MWHDIIRPTSTYNRLRQHLMDISTLVIDKRVLFFLPPQKWCLTLGEHIKILRYKLKIIPKFNNLFLVKLLFYPYILELFSIWSLYFEKFLVLELFKFSKCFNYCKKSITKYCNILRVLWHTLTLNICLKAQARMNQVRFKVYRIENYMCWIH